MIPLCVMDDIIELRELPACPAIFVPKLFSIFFSSLLRSDISLLVSSYPPMMSKWGRYFVCAAFLTLYAISFFTLAILSCLLLRNAMARQESSVNSFCASAWIPTTNAKMNIIIVFLIQCIFPYTIILFYLILNIYINSYSYNLIFLMCMSYFCYET